MNLVNPERLMIKSIEPQGKPYQQTKNKEEQFPLFFVFEIDEIDVHEIIALFRVF
jgi:hypothetical protein